MIPVNIAEISFDGEIRAEIFGAYAGKLVNPGHARVLTRTEPRQGAAEADQRGRVE
jgi:hypothetical protein